MRSLRLALLACLLGGGCNYLMQDRAPASICGNGVLEDGEECDGTPVDGRRCSPACRFIECGNGFLEEGEECDNGSGNDNTGDCTTECRKARCGDGYVKTHSSKAPEGGVDPTLERCDDHNTVNGDGCNPQCSMLGRVSVIGGEPGGMGIADGIGSGARLAEVSGLAAYGTRLYFAESGSCLIRVLNLPTNEVRTVAGLANECNLLKDGPAPKATFSKAAMAMARVGSDLYVGQMGFLRKLALEEPQQPVSTCLEQPGAQLVALAADPQQSDVLYVAEPRALYKVSLPCDCASAASARSCSLTLLAGDKKAQPQAVDGPASTARFVAVQSLAVNSRDNLLYVGDGASIRVLDLATGSVLTMAGQSTSPGHENGSVKVARLGLVRGLALVGDSLYFTEQSLDSATSLSDLNSKISLGWGNLRRMGQTVSSDIETVAGTFGPIPSVDAGENDSYLSNARFVNPGPLALVGSESKGVLVIGEQASLREYALGSGPGAGMVTTASGVLEKNFSYHQVSTAVAKDGHVYVANWLGQITRVPVSDSRPVEVLDSCTGAAHVPVALALSGSTLFVADTALHGVCAIDLAPVPQAPRMVMGGIDLASWAVSGMAAVEQSLYFACRADGTIRRADRASGEITLVKDSLFNPWALAVVDGALLVTITEGNMIVRIDLKTGATRRIGSGLAQTRDSQPGDPDAPALCHPTGLAWDPERRQLFVAETHCLAERGYQGHAVRQIDWDSGTITTLLGPGPRPYLKEGTGSFAGVNWVGALTFDNQTKSLYAADTWESVLLKIE